MRDFGSSENGKYILILEVHYEYTDNDGNTRPEIVHYMPVEIRSETFPTTAQIENAIVERLNSTGRSDYGVSDITNFYILNNRNREDLVVRSVGVRDYAKLKSSNYNQRDGHCAVDWLCHHVQHDGRVISQSWFERRFYDYCGKDITAKKLIDFIKKFHRNISLIVLDGTGGTIDKVVASVRKGDHQTLGVICTNNHLYPIDNRDVVRRMMRNTFNDRNAPDLLKICKINFDYRNALFIDFTKETIKDVREGIVDCPFDFTIGSPEQAVITNMPISILIKIINLKYPELLIEAVSTDNKTITNPITKGIITSMSDYQERAQAFRLIKNSFEGECPKEFEEFICNTFSAMACNLFEMKYGLIDKSYINPLIIGEKIRLSPKPNNDVFMEPEDVDRYRFKQCYDIIGCYNNGVKKYLPGQYLPIYDGRENIEDYTGGEIEVGEYLCSILWEIWMCI